MPAIERIHKSLNSNIAQLMVSLFVLHMREKRFVLNPSAHLIFVRVMINIIFMINLGK